KRYNSSPAAGIYAEIPRFSYKNFSPYAEGFQAKIKTKNDPALYNCSMDLLAVSAGVMRQFSGNFPQMISDKTFLDNSWHAGLYAFYGISRISFTSEAIAAPVTDYVSAAGVRGSFSYDITESFSAGISCGVQRFFTAGTPLDCTTFGVFAGVRL
ncbi:MAG: hypothetical protein ACRCUT_11100, partial [Spirochaetota bacterium]